MEPLPQDGLPDSAEMLPQILHPPNQRASQGWWGGLLETERLSGVIDQKRLLQRSTPEANYARWKREQHRARWHEPLQMLERFSFPPVSQVPDSASEKIEHAAQLAFGKKDVLLARDHLAVELPPEDLERHVNTAAL
jgi:hypothetical protein